eukprot:SAG22_NODE_1551_length_4144_cov_9.739431_5_plen_247_part_00
MIQHRDLSPPANAPLESHAADLREGGPRYVQWNVALYPDDVLQVVPGSHLVAASPEQARIMRAECPYGTTHCHAPLPSAVTVTLKAGDGVAYLSPTILHRGRSYTSATKRRTIHGGFVAGVTCAVHIHFLRHLSLPSRTKFARWRGHKEHFLDAEEAVLRAALRLDQVGYQAALEALVPGQRARHGRRHNTILLSKVARRIAVIHANDGLCEAIAAAGTFADANPALEALVQKLAPSCASTICPQH